MEASHNLRKQIIRAACHLIGKQGMTHFTLDNIAQEAKISKGGLLYHFPSKEMLIQAMVENFLHELKSQLKKESYILKNGNNKPSNSNNWLNNYILACFDREITNNEYKYAIIAALVTNPTLLSPVIHFFNESQKEVQSLTLASIIRLTCEGLWLSDLFGFQIIDDLTREKVKQELMLLVGKI